MRNDNSPFHSLTSFRFNPGGNVGFLAVFENFPRNCGHSIITPGGRGISLRSERPYGSRQDLLGSAVYVIGGYILVDINVNNWAGRTITGGAGAELLGITEGSVVALGVCGVW